MKRKHLIIISILAIGLIAWSPWIIEEYAYSRVMEHLGGPENTFLYLGETMLLQDVPKSFVKLPFVSLVYFPGEAMFIVTFYCSVG